jgi:hypothetical protein
LITPTWLLANLIVLFGAFITGITGFGFVLIAAALLLLFLDVKSVVILNVILGTKIAIYLLLACGVLGIIEAVMTLW